MNGPLVLVRPCFADYRLVSLEKRTFLDDVDLLPGFTILSKEQLNKLTANGYKVVIEGEKKIDYSTRSYE